MTIDQSDVIDAVSRDDSGKVVLTIVDHLGWNDDGMEHLFLLQEKINAYLAFVESGEIFENFPEYKGSKVYINIVCKYELSEAAFDFFNKCLKVVRGAGMDLKYEIAA